MTFIKEQIEIVHKKGGLICVCLGKIDWNKRIIGYVKNVYASKFKLEIVDEYGQKKGTKSFLFNAVRSLEMGGVYNANLEKLNKGGFEKSRSAPKYYISGKHNLYGKLHELMDASTICTFFFTTEFSIGKVVGVSQTEFWISNISYDGSSDGMSVFDLASLTKIRWASNLERRISFLSQL